MGKGAVVGLFPPSGANSDICLLSSAVGNVGRWGLPPWKQQHLPSPFPHLVLPWLDVCESPSSPHADMRYEAPASTTYPTWVWPRFAPELMLSPLPSEAHTVHGTPADCSPATLVGNGFQFHPFPPARYSWAHQLPLHGGVPFMDFPGGI